MAMMDAGRPTGLDAGQDAPEDGVSVGEAARVLGISTAAVRKRIRRGTLPAMKVGEQWYVAREGLAAVQAAERDAAPDAAPDAGHPVGQAAAPDAPDVRAVDAAYDAGRAAGLDAGRDGEIRRLEETVAVLKEELDVRRREAERLHTLLMQAQQLALPPPAASPEIHSAGRAGQQDAGAAQGPAAQERRPWWKFW